MARDGDRDGDGDGDGDRRTMMDGRADRFSLANIVLDILQIKWCKRVTGRISNRRA